MHEVIRLSGMNIIVDDTDHPLIIKVATLQPTRLQVYFIDNDDFFYRHNTAKHETVDWAEINDERTISSSEALSRPSASSAGAPTSCTASAG